MCVRACVFVCHANARRDFAANDNLSPLQTLPNDAAEHEYQTRRDARNTLAMNGNNFSGVNHQDPCISVP